MILAMHTTAEQISLDGRCYLRVKHGPYLIGHFRSVTALNDALDGLGIDLADIEIA